MFKSFLQTTDDAITLAIVVMIFFFLIFIGVIIHVVTLKKGFVKKASRLPLDEEINKQEYIGESNG